MQRNLTGWIAEVVGSWEGGLITGAKCKIALKTSCPKLSPVCHLQVGVHRTGPYSEVS